MVFRRMEEKDHKTVMEYLKKEPEFNLFIIGDLENYGYNSDFQTIWGVIEENNLKGILLRYYDSFIPYSYDEVVIKKFAPLISLGARVLSGKMEIIEKVKPELTVQINMEKREYFARLLQLNSEYKPSINLKMKKADITDIDRILELRSLIEEFRGIKANKKMIVKKIESGSGRIYYIEDEKGRIISSAATSAENSCSAMVVGVATLPQYRKQGLATGCVYRICEDLLAENKIPCLFYDNPAAGSIYRKLGFEEIGRWNILQLNKPD